MEFSKSKATGKEMSRNEVLKEALQSSSDEEDNNQMVQSTA